MVLHSIKQKFAIMAGFCLFLSAAVLIIYGLVSSNNTNGIVTHRVNALLEKSTLKHLGSLASNQAAIIQSTLQDNLDTARTLAKTFEILQSLKTGEDAPLRADFTDILLGVLKNNPTYLGAYTAWEPNALDKRDGEFAGKSAEGYDATGRFIPYWNRNSSGKIAKQALVDYESQESYENGIRKGGWYLRPKETGQENVLDPFPYLVQGRQHWLTTLSVPIKKDGKFLGVAGTDLRLDAIQELAKTVNNSLYNGKGDVIIISFEGIVVANSKNPDSIGKPIGSLFPNAREVLDNVQHGKNWAGISTVTGLMVAYAPVKLGRTGRPWSVLIRVPQDVAMADARTLDAELAARGRSNAAWQVGVGLAVTLAGICLVWFFTGTITRPIQKAARYAEKVAEGDFNQHLDVRQQDEVGVLAKALGTMVTNLKAKIAEAEAKGGVARQETEKAKTAMAAAEEAQARAERAKAEGMLQAANKLEHVVEIVTSASEELSAQVEQSSHGAEEQSRRVTETATSMEEMNSTVLEVAKNASNAAHAADEAKLKAEDGAKIVGTVMAGIAEVRQQSMEMGTDMSNLGRQAEGIGQIMNVISDIADQTNLLALNAAIEAARAGEAGRGFAVVADEVRKLAEKTMTATKEVGEAIRGIQTGTKKNIENVERSGKTIEEATAMAGKSGEALREIVTLVESTTDQVRSIATASEEQSSASEEINHSIEDVNRISSETADAMRQSAQAVTELANQSQILKNLIEDMQREGSAAQPALAPGQRALPQAAGARA